MHQGRWVPLQSNPRGARLVAQLIALELVIGELAHCCLRDILIEALLLCGFILIRGSKDEPKGEGADESQPSKDEPLTELFLLFLIHSVLSIDE